MLQEKFGFVTCKGHKVFHGTWTTFSYRKGDSLHVYVGVVFAGSASNVFHA